jgi:hypothetical protein
MSTIAAAVVNLAALGDQTGSLLVMVSLSAPVFVSAVLWSIKRVRQVVIEWAKLLDALAAGIEKWRQFKRAVRADERGPKRSKPPREPNHHANDS